MKLSNGICHTVYNPLFKRLLMSEQVEVLSRMGIKNHSTYARTRSISETQYEILKNFAAKYVSNNTVGFEAFFDYNQTKQYYIGLTNLINSGEIKVTPEVMNEHIKIGKQLINI